MTAMRLLLALVLALVALAPPAAAQPLTTVTEDALLFTDLSGDRSNASFGAEAAAVDLPDGSALAAVGAPLAAPPPGTRFRGAVAVYRRGPAGDWAPEAVLRSPSDDPFFGRAVDAVALPGGDIVLAAGHDRHSDSRADHGAVVVYRRDGATGTWGPGQLVSPPQLAEADRFGSAVAAEPLPDGRVRLVVGAPQRRHGGVASGTAFVLEGAPGGEWEVTAELAPTGATGRELAGRHVALAGDVAVVSAEDAPAGGVALAGAAYVFVRDPATGAWAAEARLVSAEPRERARFGRDVAAVETGAGTVVVVGEPSTPTGGAAATFVRRRDGPAGPWTWDRGPVLAPHLGAHRGGVGNVVAAAPLARGRAVVLVTAGVASLDGEFATGSATAFTLAPERVVEGGGQGPVVAGLVVEETAHVRPATVQRVQYFGGTGTRDEADVTPSGLAVVGSDAYRHPGGAQGAAYAFRLGPALAVSSEGGPAGRPAGVSVSVGPNPSRGRARVALSGAVGAEPVRVVVLDVRGREVAVVWDGPAAGGASWALPALAPGAYAVRAETAAGAATAWITVVR